MRAWRPRVFEVFLQPTRPFSVRASGKLEDLLDKAGEDRITVPGSAYSRIDGSGWAECILGQSPNQNKIRTPGPTQHAN